MNFKIKYPKLVFIVGTLGLGGAERQLYYILKVMKENGGKPIVLCLTSGEPWERKIRNLGVPVIFIGRFRLRIARLAYLLLILCKYRPEIIQSAHFYVNIYTYIAAKFFKAYGIGALRNDTYGEVRRMGFWGNLSLYLPRILIANSLQGIKNAIALGVPKKRLKFLPNAVDTSKFNRYEKDCGNRINILTIGRLKPQKRIDRFLSVLAQVISRLPTNIEIRGNILGSGPLKKELVDQAKRLRLFPNYVVFQESGEDVVAAYNSADIFVLTSDAEGTPNVILEAMACGLPVVAFRVGGIPEIIFHGDTGFLVDPENDDYMVNIILTLAIDSKLRKQIGRRAKEYVANFHSFDKLKESLVKIYSEVMQY